VVGTVALLVTVVVCAYRPSCPWYRHLWVAKWRSRRNRKDCAADLDEEPAAAVAVAVAVAVHPPEGTADTPEPKK
jgi:hypothetical protein